MVQRGTTRPDTTRALPHYGTEGFNRNNSQSGTLAIHMTKFVYFGLKNPVLLFMGLGNLAPVGGQSNLTLGYHPMGGYPLGEKFSMGRNFPWGVIFRDPC